MNIQRSLISGLSLLVATQVCVAQATQCLSQSSSCFQQELESACTDGSTANASTCLAFIRELKSESRQSEYQSLLYLGHAYNMMSRSAPTGSQEETTFVAQARVAFAEHVHKFPNDPEGYHALANMAGSESERISLLSRVADLMPTNVLKQTILADALESRGTPADLLRAGERLERATIVANGDRRWNLSARATALFERAGQAERGAALRKSVRDAVRFDTLRNNLVNGTGLPNRDSFGELGLLCNGDIVALLGSRACIESISGAAQRIVSATGDRGGSARQDAANRLAEVVVGSLSDIESKINGSYPGWRSVLGDQFQQMRSRGLGSVQVVDAFAGVTDDVEARLEARKKIVQLAPNAVGQRISLATEYLSRGNLDEAERELRAAKASRNFPVGKEVDAERMIDMYLDLIARGRARER